MFAAAVFIGALALLTALLPYAAFQASAVVLGTIAVVLVRSAGPAPSARFERMRRVAMLLGAVAIGYGIVSFGACQAIKAKVASELDQRGRKDEGRTQREALEKTVAPAPQPAHVPAD